MFKSIDTSGREHVSLDLSPEQRDGYYALARDNELLCPECHQPVWFKAGEFKEYHFAHKDRGKCPLADESKEMLRARALLYRLAVSRFGSGVRMEVRMEGLPRFIDVYVETAADQKIAYWIIAGRFKDRWNVVGKMSELWISVNFVFLASMMQRNNKDRDALNLTPTERELMPPSPFSCAYWPTRLGGGSAHTIAYLDPETGVMTSFRGMSCTEPPQAYVGYEVISPVGEMIMESKNGELFHPGEMERLEDAARRWKEEDERARRAEEERRRNRRELDRQWEDERRAARAAIKNAMPAEAATSPAPSIYDRPLLRCVFCGQTTKEWWTNMQDGETCKCKACSRAGKS